MGVLAAVVEVVAELAVVDELPVGAGERVHRARVLGHLALGALAEDGALLEARGEHVDARRLVEEPLRERRAERLHARHHGREEVDERDDRLEPGRQVPATARQAEDERDAQLLLPHEAVRGPVVLVQPLAVVGGEDHDRAPPQLQVAHAVEEHADLGVGVGHLTAVAVHLAPGVADDHALRAHGGLLDPALLQPRVELRVGLVHRPVGLRRLVLPVRVVEVHEEEHALVRVVLQPGEHLLHHLLGGALAPLRLVPVVEAEADPGGGLQGGRPDEAGGGVALVPGHLGEGQHLVLPAEEPAAVDHVRQDPVLEGVAAREHGGMAGERRGHGGVAALELDRLRGQPVDVGRGVPEVPVGPQVVRPERVDADQEDVGVRTGLLPAPTGGRQEEDREDSGEGSARHGPAEYSPLRRPQRPPGPAREGLSGGYSGIWRAFCCPPPLVPRDAGACDGQARSRSGMFLESSRTPLEGSGVRPRRSFPSGARKNSESRRTAPPEIIKAGPLEGRPALSTSGPPVAWHES